MMFKLLIVLLLGYAIYSLFLKDKIIVISPKPPRKGDIKYTDFEEGD